MKLLKLLMLNIILQHKALAKIEKFGLTLEIEKIVKLSIQKALVWDFYEIILAIVVPM